jgi:hypothetical protein
MCVTIRSFILPLMLKAATLLAIFTVKQIDDQEMYFRDNLYYIFTYVANSNNVLYNVYIT